MTTNADSRKDKKVDANAIHIGEGVKNPQLMMKTEARTFDTILDMGERSEGSRN